MYKTDVYMVKTDNTALRAVLLSPVVAFSYAQELAGVRALRGARRAAAVGATHITLLPE